MPNSREYVKNLVVQLSGENRASKVVRDMVNAMDSEEVDALRHVLEAGMKGKIAARRRGEEHRPFLIG